MKIFEDGFKLDISGIFSLIVPIILHILVLIIAFVIFVPIGKKIISKALQKAGNSDKLSPGRVKTLEKLLLNIFRYAMIFVFIVMLFAILSIPIGPLLAGAGIIGLAVGFGAQGLVSDIVTGFFILLERQIEIDDYVTAGGYDGVVEEVGLRTTKIRDFDGTLYFVPNREIVGVANHSRGNMRAQVYVTVKYNENLHEAVTVLENICTEFADDERFKEGPTLLGVQSLDPNNFVLRVEGMTENFMQWGCERDMRKRIKEEFDQANLQVPFPQQVSIAEEQ
ncbi:mechanosensitive ion channel family protein [Lentibacillus sp. N15]|uniref:mechanosensitive ion channel family protein n=1 Tax=Lentibacillus songyuanensis TaxID=3136161 RepID=UPI0031BA1529